DNVFDGGVAAVINGGTGPVTEPPANGVATTQFTAVVTPNNFPAGFRTITDLDVAITLVHPHLNQLTITLTAPDGNVLTLGNPSTDAAGTAIPGQGLVDNAGASNNQSGLGVINSHRAVTVFDNEAARSIRNPNNNNVTTNAAPYIAHFRPEGSFFDTANLD